MNASHPVDRTVILSWLHGLLCGLGIAATTVGIVRGEALPGVLWPAMIPLLCAPLVVLIILDRSKKKRPI